ISKTETRPTSGFFLASGVCLVHSCRHPFWLGFALSALLGRSAAQDTRQPDRAYFTNQKGRMLMHHGHKQLLFQ
ncbi:MAG: hypothetical protein ABIR13_00170, partial [Polaromonas sp.]